MAALEPVSHDPFAAERLLDEPIIRAALALPFVINNKYCVKLGAGRSNDNKKTYVDKHVPQYDKHFRVRGGEVGSLWRYVDIHEKSEFAVMTKLGWSYDDAHEKVATVLERYFVEKDGGDWKEYEACWDGFLNEAEHEHDKPPPDLYMGPYEKSKTKLEPVSHDPFKEG